MPRRRRRVPRPPAGHPAGPAPPARRRPRRSASGSRTSRRRPTWTTSTATSCASRAATRTSSAASRRSSPPSWHARAAEGQTAWMGGPRGARRGGVPARAAAQRRAGHRLRRAASTRAEHPYDRCSTTTTPASTARASAGVRAACARRCRPSSSAARPAGPGRRAAVPRRRASATPCARCWRRLGVDDAGWRLDDSEHPFTSWVGPEDTRITTRYPEANLEVVLAGCTSSGTASTSAPSTRPARTNLGGGTSMSVHESQSKLWENHVGRSRPFAGLIAAGDRAARPSMRPACTPTSRRAAGRIRVRPTRSTYPLAHRGALRARARPARRQPGSGRPAGGVRRRVRELLGVAPSTTSRRRPAGHPLGRRRVRVLPELRAGLRHRRAAVGAARRRRGGADGPRRRRRRADPRVAARARPPPGAAPGHRGPRARGDGHGLDPAPFLRGTSPRASTPRISKTTFPNSSPSCMALKPSAASASGIVAGSPGARRS